MSTRSHLRQLETAVIVYCWVQVQNDKKNFDIKLLFCIIKYTLRNKLKFLKQKQLMENQYVHRQNGNSV